MQALRARLRGPGRIDRDHLDSGTGRFVLDVDAQLVERPGVVHTALGLADLPVRPVADVGQVFQSNGLLLLFGLLNDVLAHLMVYPRLVAAFLARKPFEDTARILARRRRTLICLRLKGTAHLVPFQPVSIQRLTTHRGPIGKRSNVLDTQVDAQRAGCLQRIGQRFLDLDVKEVTFLLFDQRGRGGILAGQCLELEVAHLQRDPHPAIQQGKADAPVLFMEAEDPRIVINTGRLKGAVPRLGLTQSRRNPSNDPDRQIGRQAKSFPDRPVTSLVQVVLTRDMLLAPPGGNPVAGVRKSLDCGVYRFGLVRRGNQLTRNRSDSFHTLKYSEHPFNRQEVFRFLPGLTTGVSTKENS